MLITGRNDNILDILGSLKYTFKINFTCFLLLLLVLLLAINGHKCDSHYISIGQHQSRSLAGFRLNVLLTHFLGGVLSLTQRIPP